MEIKYYYFRGSWNRPLVTVCIAKDGDKYHRGISICHPNDRPVKKVGRVKALGRLRQAMHKESGAVVTPLSWNAHMVLTAVIPSNAALVDAVLPSSEAVAMGRCNVKPTPFEERLFQKPKYAEQK